MQQYCQAIVRLSGTEEELMWLEHAHAVLTRWGHRGLSGEEKAMHDFILGHKASEIMQRGVGFDCTVLHLGGRGLEPPTAALHGDESVNLEAMSRLVRAYAIHTRSKSTYVVRAVFYSDDVMLAEPDSRIILVSARVVAVRTMDSQIPSHTPPMLKETP